MRRPIAVLATAAMLAAAGCGGDDELSADDYRAEVRKICTEGNRQIDRIEEPTRATSQAIVDYFERLLRVNERNTERIEDLDPPEELKAAHARALKANQEGVEQVRKLIAELKKGDDPIAVLRGARDELERIGRQADKAARDLRVPECAD